MKKFIALAMSALMAFSFSAAALADVTEAPLAPVPEDFKAGFIFLHDENSTYDLNFINAAKEAAEILGMSEDQIILKTNVPEGQECYEEAMDMADQGCGIVFADSFGHEDYMIQAARRKFRKCSSATRPVPRRTPKDLTTITTRLRRSTRADSWPALRQV